MTRKKTEATESRSGTPPTFEQALDRLETIVSEMESGALSLEDMMGRFEEGQALVKVCSEKLNQVERRIEILVKEGDKVTAKPFEGPDAGAKESADDASEDDVPGTTPGVLPF